MASEKILATACEAGDVAACKLLAELDWVHLTTWAAIIIGGAMVLVAVTLGLSGWLRNRRSNDDLFS